MKDEEIKRKLQQAGIKQGSQDWNDYIQAKKVLLGDKPYSPAMHNKVILAISNYIDV